MIFVSGMPAGDRRELCQSADKKTAGGGRGIRDLTELLISQGCNVGLVMRPPRQTRASPPASRHWDSREANIIKNGVPLRGRRCHTAWVLNIVRKCTSENLPRVLHFDVGLQKGANGPLHLSLALPNTISAVHDRYTKNRD